MSEPIAYKLKYPATPGPDCMFRVNRPDLGMVGEGYIFNVLAKNVAAWRTANGLPIGLGFEQELLALVCEQHPDLCYSEDPRAPMAPVALNFRDVTHGTMVMASFIKSGRVVVSKEEAERRAAICSTCRFNVQFSRGCGGGLCGELLELVKRIVPTGTSYDDKLNACYICRCYLQASVWLPLAMQRSVLTNHQLVQFEQAKDWCWKAQEATPSSSGEQ